MKSSIIENGYYNYKKETEFHKEQLWDIYNFVMLFISMITVIIIDIVIYKNSRLEGIRLIFILGIVCIALSCAVLRFFVDIYVERKLCIKEEDAIKNVIKRISTENRSTSNVSIKAPDKYKNSFETITDFQDNERIKISAWNALIRIISK